MSARATCTWGDGPPVLVIVGRVNRSGHGWLPAENNAGSFGLTAQEVRTLAAQLIAAVETVEAFDRAAAAATQPKDPR